MAHCQVPALPQSDKGEVYMKNSRPDCGLKAMCLVKAKVRVFKKIVIASYLVISVTLNIQIRTGEELVY